MKVADADHPQIFKLRLRLTEPMMSPTTHIDEYSRPTIDPEKVARRNANWIESGTAGAEDLHGHRTSAAALCGGARPIHRDREKSEQANDRESNHENLRPFEWLTVIGQRLMRAMCQSADIVDRLVGRLVAWSRRGRLRSFSASSGPSRSWSRRGSACRCRERRPGRPRSSRDWQGSRRSALRSG